MPAALTVRPSSWSWGESLSKTDPNAVKITELDMTMLQRVNIEHEGCGDYIVQYGDEEDDEPRHCPGCGQEAPHGRR